jgi:hypothetical protein
LEAAEESPSYIFLLQFEEVFSKYDRGNKGGLTLSELNEMVGGVQYGSLLCLPAGSHVYCSRTGALRVPAACSHTLAD